MLLEILAIIGILIIYIIVGRFYGGIKLSGYHESYINYSFDSFILTLFWPVAFSIDLIGFSTLFVHNLGRKLGEYYNISQEDQ